MADQHVEILIIGAGPAGLAAAIAAREAGIESILILEREDEPGGILRQCIHNGFGLHRFGLLYHRPYRHGGTQGKTRYVAHQGGRQSV